MLPERPGDAGVVFVDNPAIVDSAADARRIVQPASPIDRAVTVHFTTGTPECYGVHATVAETADRRSAVELHGGTLPEAVGRACIMIAVSGTARGAAGRARWATGRFVSVVLTLDKRQ